MKIIAIHTSSVVVFLFLLSVSSFAEVGYSSSAHGDNSAGVSRVALAANYVTGNCAHCHEQHASIDGDEPSPSGGAGSALLLADAFNSNKIRNSYSQSDNVCFYCHSTTGSLQNGAISNKNYSATFGGAPAATTGILEAFNLSSYHNLYDIQRSITGHNGTFTFPTFSEGTNPCMGCHNVHIAKANKDNPGDPTYSAISRPADHGDLWGDDQWINDLGEVVSRTERMPSASYQPPYTISNSTNEPDGLSSDRVTQANKTPDYNTFCIDCHNTTSIIYSTTLGRNLRTFDWTGVTATPEMHGVGSATNTGRPQVVYPFLEFNQGSYVLSCTDCHEPHGSSNAFLIRNYVNGDRDTDGTGIYAIAGPVVLPPGSIDWIRLCSRCHDMNSFRGFHHDVRGDLDSYGDPLFTCSSCHPDLGNKKMVQNCNNCHFHGSSTTLHKLF